MTKPTISTDCRQVLDRADALARARGEAAVTTTHLLLAVMLQAESPWPELIVERGGMTFRNAIRRLGWQDVGALERAGQDPVPYRSSMRLMVVILITASMRLTVAVQRRSSEPTPHPVRDLGAAEAVNLAARFAASPRSSGETADEVGVGHLLLALASSPGQHLRLLENSTVLACAARRELDLGRWHHRLVLACDRGNLQVRRVRMRLDRRVAAHGRRSGWGAAWLGYSGLGLLAAAIVFPITVLANVLLYIFLWPGALLLGGMRAACAAIAGCEVSNHRWHEIPGGEAALTGVDTRISERRVALVFIAPRVLATLLSLAALVVLLWRVDRLGVAVFPTTAAQQETFTGSSDDSLWMAPLVLLGDMLEQNGMLAGIGLLAGLGLGFMVIPTYRELCLIRLYTGHEIGVGTRVTRYLTLPASMFTGLIACIEAILPFRNGPIYLTVYIVPVFFLVFLAGFIVSQLPY